MNLRSTVACASNMWSTVHEQVCLWRAVQIIRVHLTHELFMILHRQLPPPVLRHVAQQYAAPVMEIKVRGKDGDGGVCER